MTWRRMGLRDYDRPPFLLEKKARPGFGSEERSSLGHVRNTYKQVEKAEETRRYLPSWEGNILIERRKTLILTWVMSVSRFMYMYSELITSPRCVGGYL